MINLNLVYGRKKLSIKFGNKRGRPKKTLASAIGDFALYLKRVYQDNRFTGNKISRVLRRVFEIKKIKEAIGVNLMFVAFFSIAVNQPISAFTLQPKTDLIVYAIDKVKITTERSINRPLDSFQISQGYHFFHRAIDLQEANGSPVYSIRKGKVKKIVHSSFGYGNHLVIEHEKNLESLYAHLGKIRVQKEEAVDENTVLGTVGTSGWSTGPHLHLEIHRNGQPINPLTILE